MGLQRVGLENLPQFIYEAEREINASIEMEMKSTSSALSRNNRNRINQRRLILTGAVMGNNIDR